jgi:hypothetical protein
VTVVALGPRGGVPARGRRLPAGAGEDVARFLARRAEEELAQARNRRALVLDQLRHVAQRADRGGERCVVGVTERPLPGALDHALEVRQVQGDPGTRRRQR